jgi:MFS family permease
MMALFYIGSGLSLGLAAIAPNLTLLGVAMFGLGTFAAIYHPVGMAMLIDVSQARGRSLAFNGVCGNMGAALAAGVSAAFASWFGWRYAFAIPALICVIAGVAFLAFAPDDRHRTGKRQSRADIVLSPNAAATMFGLYIVISLASGLIFNTISVALPKIVDERLAGHISLLAVGGLTTGVFLCGALAQMAMGRLVERLAPHWLFAGVVAFQFIGLVWAMYASGLALLVALALTMSMIYGQVTAGDIVIARYTADAWRGRIYAVRYFLTFISSAIAVAMIAFLHARGGFSLVLGVIAVAAGILVVAVAGFVALVTTASRQPEPLAEPAE